MSFDSNPVIARLREARKTMEAIVTQKAIATYATFDKNERLVVQFGMFPHDKMLKAQGELIAEFTLADGEEPDSREISRLLAVGIMDCANRGPDKMVV